MDDYTSDPNPGPLDKREIRRLRDLVRQMRDHQGAWGEAQGGELISPGLYSMPWVDTDKLAYKAMDWLYESKRVFWFNWPEWDEGREIFENWSDRRVASFDHLMVRKLLTAIARNDHFCEGAWAQFFEDGQGQLLFTRLLQLENELARKKTDLTTP